MLAGSLARHSCFGEPAQDRPWTRRRRPHGKPRPIWVRHVRSRCSSAAVLDAGTISARLDRLPATRSIWKLVVLLSLGFLFELYDLLYTGYVAPGLVKSGLLTATTHGLFGTTGVASFIAALFAGLFIGTIACGFLADRFGRRAVFTYSLLWYTVANVVSMQSRHYPVAAYPDRPGK